MKDTDTPSQTRKLEQSMKSFGVLAQNEDWLADNFDKMVHAQELSSGDPPSKNEPASKPIADEALQRSRSIFCDALARA